MQATLLGVRKLDFKDDSGAPIKGTQIFISHREDGVLGEMAEKKFLADGFNMPTINPGDLLDLDCNTKGKILGIKVISGSPANSLASTPGK